MKYIFFYTIIFAAFFLPFFIKPSKLAEKDNDLGRTYVPIYQDVKNSFDKYGQIPLWSDRQMAGESLVASPLPALFYPVNVIFLILPVKFASIFYLFLHFTAAAAFTYWLAKSFKFSNIASFSAGIFYAFSFKFLLHTAAGHITMVAAFSYFPLLLLSVRKIIFSDSKAWMVVAAISSCFLILTHPTIYYYSLFFVFAYVFYLSLKSYFQNKNLLTLEKYLIVAASLLAGFGLSAVSLIPNLEYSAFSTRSHLTLAEIAVPLWNIKRFLLSLFLPYARFADLDQESFLYLGAVPILLCSFAFFKLLRFQKWVLALSGVFALLFAAGLSTPLFSVIYKFVPFINYLRITTRFWFIVALVTALLGAYAIDRIKNKTVVLFLIFVFLLESTLIFYKKLQSTSNLDFNNQGLYEFLKNDVDVYKVYCTTYCFNPQMALSANIELLNGETPIQNKDLVSFLQMAGGYLYQDYAVIFPPYQVWQIQSPPVPNAQLLGEANVKYIASTYEIKNPDFKFIDKFEGVSLYQIPKFNPRAYFENSESSVKIKRQAPNTLNFEFDKSADYRKLIVTQNYYPGLFAEIDNQRVPIKSSEGVFNQIDIGPNTDKVQIQYKPESLVSGSGVTIFTIVLLGLYLWRADKKRI